MLFPEKIKSLFYSAVDSVAGRMAEFSDNPGKDFTRRRKLPADKLIPFLVLQGSSGTRNELVDFFGAVPEKPSASAFNQRRAKLKPEAVEAVFNSLASSLDSLDPPGGYRYIAADGSTVTYPSKPKFSPDEYYVSSKSSAKGFYSMHVNAFYDLDRHTYTDALIQPVHGKDEFSAFCKIVDRHAVLPGSKNVYIGDRGYCSYNNMAHVMETGQYFLFRTKDIDQKGLVGNFGLPEGGSFDIRVKVAIVRTHSRKVKTPDGYRRFIGKNVAFDFLDYGSTDVHYMEFRVVRFQLPDGSYECLLTNLPESEFPPGKLEELYFSRWGEETSFRKLKYTIGLVNFHACKPDFVRQEIWARLIAYNLTESLINLAAINAREMDCKHDYKVNFSVAAHICRVFLRPQTEASPEGVTRLLEKELVPIRKDRKYSRLQTAHFRKPHYFLYRAS